MTPGEALRRLRELQEPSDPDAALRQDIEAIHLEADGILCAVLEHFGEYEIVEAWRKVQKWYA